MEIINHRQQMLDAIESNGIGNNNFATIVISKGSVEGNISILKKFGRYKVNFFFFS